MAILTYTVLGVREASLNLTRLQTKFVPLVRLRITQEIAKAIRDKAPVGGSSPGLKGSVVADITLGAVTVEAPYATFVEYGTAAGYFPNIGNITPWAEAHGIAPGALAGSILKEGTKAHPFVRPAVDEVTPRIPIIAEEVFRGLGIL